MGVLLLGLLLILIGWLAAVPVLYTIGIIFVIVGIVLMFIPSVPGRPAGRRYHYW